MLFLFISDFMLSLSQNTEGVNIFPSDWEFNEVAGASKSVVQIWLLQSAMLELKVLDSFVDLGQGSLKVLVCIPHTL